MWDISDHIGDIASVYCGIRRRKRRLEILFCMSLMRTRKRRTDFSFDFVSNRKNIRADSMW